MRKRIKTIVLILILTCAFAGALAGCSPDEYVLESLKVSTPCKTEYLLGESFDISGGVLEAKYSNGAVGYVYFTDEAVSFTPMDRETAGEQIITVRYDTVSTTFKVFVRDVAEKIEIASPPSKTEYVQGEPLSVRGFALKVSYQGGYTRTVAVTSDMVSGFDPETVGEQTLTVGYPNNGQVLTLQFTVNVRKKVVDGFYLSKKPSKLNYKLGAELELSDAEFRVSYDNNSPKDCVLKKDSDGTYFLEDYSGNRLEESVTILTEVSGGVYEEGFLSDTTGSKNILFRYQDIEAYGLRVNVVKKEIESSSFSGPDTLFIGTPADVLPLFFDGCSVTLVFTDEEVKTYRFPEAFEQGARILDFDPVSEEPEQWLTFDFGADGAAAFRFRMEQPTITGLIPTDSKGLDLTGGVASFYTGDTLDASLWEFDLQYSNGTTVRFLGRELRLTATGFPAGEVDYGKVFFDFGTKGTYSVKFDYLGMAEYEFTAEVKGKRLDRLEIETPAMVTEYSVGDAVSLEGLALRAYYTDETTGDPVRKRLVRTFPDRESALGISYDNGIAGVGTVVLTLTEDGVSKSVEFSVSFKARVASIEIASSENAKTDYVKGQRFNPAGLVVTVRYVGAPDESVVLKEVNEGGAWTFAPEVLSTLGTVSVTVSYMNKTASLNVTVHNEIERFRIRTPDGTVVDEGGMIGAVTVGLPVPEALNGFTLIAVRENGETEETTLPSRLVEIDADNGASWEAQKTLEVGFTFLGARRVFAMTRNPRQHLYYELTGKAPELQTASAGFDPTGLFLTEFFDNGTKEVLQYTLHYEFIVPPLSVPAGADRIDAEIGIRVFADGDAPITFRYGGADAAKISVTFYQRIAKTLDWVARPDDNGNKFFVDQNTPEAEVLGRIANAGGVSFDVRLRASYSDNTSAEIVLKDHLDDFELENYDENAFANHAVSLRYKLGDNLRVDFILTINPKELVSIEFEGYLIGAQGTAERNTVVEGTDIDVSHAFLKVTFGFFYDGSQTPGKILDPVSYPVQRSWITFDKNASYSNGQKVVVPIEYVYRDGKRPIAENTKTVEVEVTVVAKSVLEVAQLNPAKSAYVEGEDFTFRAEDGASWGSLRVAYNNGTFDTVELSPENAANAEAPADPKKYYVVSNGMRAYFDSIGGYALAELSAGEAKTFGVALKYMGKTVDYQVVLKDRAYVTFGYEMHGSSAKIYGEAVGLDLILTSDGNPVTEGGRSYRFRKEDGGVFEPVAAGGFTSDGASFSYLPAGSYTIAASFQGVPLLYNPGEKDVGSFTVSKRTLTFGYGQIPSVVYGDENPDFLSYLSGTGFAAGESLETLGGYGIAGFRYTAQRAGVRLDAAPKDAADASDPYFIGAEGLSSDNYEIVFPGEGTNPYAVFTIAKRRVYIAPEDTAIVYGDTLPTIGYSAFRYGPDGVPSVDLDAKFKAELKNAPTAYSEGISPDDPAAQVALPNAGRYELNVSIMRAENPNFEIEVEQGKFLSIGKAPLTMAFEAMTVVYGDAVSFADLVGRLRIEGFKNNDEGKVSFGVAFSVGSGAPLRGDALLAAVRNAAAYRLTPSGAEFANYVVTRFTEGAFTVEPKAATVTPRAASKIYGLPDPGFEYTVSELLGGDTLSGALGREPGENVAAGGYAFTIGTLQNPNYRLALALGAARFAIEKRKLSLSVADENLRKYYDGYAPSITEFVLTLSDANDPSFGLPADGSAYFDSSLVPDRTKIRLTFSSDSPNKTSSTQPLSVYLKNGDQNHEIALQKEYRYAIERLPVEIEWLKLPISGGGEAKPFGYGSAYPYIYGGAHRITARVKTSNLTLNPAIPDLDLGVTFSSAFDVYREPDGTYALSRADTYSPSVTAVDNPNFVLSSAVTAQVSTRIVIEPNTFTVSIAEAARSKFYDMKTASVNTPDVASFTLRERARDAFGAATETGETVEITDASYKKALIGILTFTIGNKPNGVTDVAIDSADMSYPIAMSVTDQTLGRNFRADFADEESQKYFIRPRPIVIQIYGETSKVYNGEAPYVQSDQLGSNGSSYISASNLREILVFTPTDPAMRQGDVGEYAISSDGSKYRNFTFSFKEEYRYAISKKPVSVALSSGTGYYRGEKQLTLGFSDVAARDALGRGDSWDEVFSALRFSFSYLNNADYPVLNDGNAAGEKGNVGRYTVTLDAAGSVHKNYTFVWGGETDVFTVKPAEVEIRPVKTSSVYGFDESQNPPYRAAYGVRFPKGSDGSGDGSVFRGLAFVTENLLLDRSDPSNRNVGYYNIALSAGWTGGCVDGVNAGLPNYRVTLYEGNGKFEITKRPLTVRIEDKRKTFGEAITGGDIRFTFPSFAGDLTAGDDLAAVFAEYGYALRDNADGTYSLSDFAYRYVYLGSAEGAANPQDALAFATREPDGAGGVYGYRIRFGNMPNLKNYNIVYAETDGVLTIAPKALTFAVSDFGWTYRDAWITGAADADETLLNFGNHFTVSGKVSGDPDAIRYPALAKEAGFASALTLLTTGNAGQTATIAREWFDEALSNSPERNRNYVFDFDAFDVTRTAAVVKARLDAVLRTAADKAETPRVYGTLPAENELKIVYSGFRGDDAAIYAATPDAVVQTGARIPAFVQSLTESAGGARTAVLYGVGAHFVAPDASAFSATNYELNVDPSAVEAPFTFRVTKKPLTVRSAPVAGTATALRKLFGTTLARGTDYEVSFGLDDSTGFVTSVLLPDGTTATVADSAETVFFGNFSGAEWVSYDPAVNVRRNVEAATEIAPNVAYMNEVSQNYDVRVVAGESLMIAIYNKIVSVSTANATSGASYAYVAERKTGENTMRVKITYLDGSAVYRTLALGGVNRYEDEAHVVDFDVAGYDAAATGNQSVTVTATEANALGETETAGAKQDRKALGVTLRIVPSADRVVSADDYTAPFVGPVALDATSSALSYTVNPGASGAAADFDVAEITFLLMRTKTGGRFDVVFYNAATVAGATHRYLIRAEVNSYGQGAERQILKIYEQAKAADGTFPEIDEFGEGWTYSVGSIDLFDGALHDYRIYLNKLTNSIAVIVDGVTRVSHVVRAGAVGDKNVVGVALDRAFGYVNGLKLTVAGCSDEDAVRVVAKSEAERVVPLGSEPLARIRPTDYFAFLWNYAADFYTADNPAPVIRYYIDGGETSGEYLSLAAGSYRFTAKAFRGATELSSASVDLTIVSGYYRDAFVHLNGDGIVGETIAPTVNQPRVLKGRDGKTYQGIQQLGYTSYRMNLDAVDLAAAAGVTKYLDVNLKSSDPNVSAFDAPMSDNGYIGLSLRLKRQGTTYTTSLALVAGGAVKNQANEMVEVSQRPAVTETTAIDWTRTDGVYTIDAAFDANNLYLRVEIFFNGQSLHVFSLDGKTGDGAGQDAETATGRATVNDPDKLYELAPVSWAVYRLASLRGGHSVILGEKGESDVNEVGLTVRSVELNTYTDARSSYVKTTATTVSNVTTLKPYFEPKRPDGVPDSSSATNSEIAYMLGDSGAAALQADGGSAYLRAGKYRYETYGVRFAATGFAGVTNKLRLILAENAPKTAAEDQNRYTAKASRNVSLTFIRRGGTTRCYFSFNDARYYGVQLDEVGEVRNVRFEQELFSFGGSTPGAGAFDPFDGTEHTVVAVFNREDSNVELGSGLVVNQTVGNYVEIYIDGVKFGDKFMFPAYNNVAPWYYIAEDGSKSEPAASTTAPFYDRRFLDEATSAGLSFRGLDLKIKALAVSEKSDHLGFLRSE